MQATENDFIAQEVKSNLQQMDRIFKVKLCTDDNAQTYNYC